MTKCKTCDGLVLKSSDICNSCKARESIKKAMAVRTKYARLDLAHRYDGRSAPTSKRVARKGQWVKKLLVRHEVKA